MRSNYPKKYLEYQINMIEYPDHRIFYVVCRLNEDTIIYSSDDEHDCVRFVRFQEAGVNDELYETDRSTYIERHNDYLDKLRKAGLL